MSSGKVGVGGGGSAGARKSNNGGINDNIPSGSRKIVQSLKEIVNSPEAEIYAMLKECNMDPNETVNRLLTQDPFHEVKSKKEKKKETRDVPDSRPRGANNTYNRSGRGGSDRYAGRTGSTHFSSTDSGNYQGKSAYKKESGTQGYTSSWSSASGVANQHQAPYSDPVATENKAPYVATENKLPSGASGDGILSSQPGSGHQAPWFGAAGQRSMADIVKMGIPQNKTTNTRQNVNMRSEINHEHETGVNVPVKDEWPSIEKPVAPATSSVSVAPAESEVCSGPAVFQSEWGNQHLKDQFDNMHLSENGPSENHGVDHVHPDSVAGGNVEDDDSGVSSVYEDHPYEYQTRSHPVEHHKDEDDVSSGSANFQQLNVDSHEQEPSREEDRPAVVIPEHLLIHSEECSQLSFGSFGGFGTRPASNNLEETSDVAPEIEHSEARNAEFYGDEHRASTENGNMAQTPTAEGYDDSLESRRDVLRQENPETAQEHQYTFAQSEPGYAYENAKQQQQLNTGFDDSQANAHNQMQNLASLSNVMQQGYAHSIPNTLLAQSARELDFQYSPFPVAQSMQSRNSNHASSVGTQSISMPEALRSSGIPATQSTQQTLPGANVATGPALPQQLPVHPYSQPAMPPLAHFANMMGYPLMPQNYPYIPSAFQQTFAGNSSYHQQLAAALPQYKTNPSNLPQSATHPASAYGFGNSTNVGSAGNFPLNQQSAPTGATLSYEDVLSSQYKESANHLLALQQQQQQQQQQNENSAMWHHGHGNRTMSGVPANAYYNLQAQQQQQQQQQQAQQAGGGYRQAQQQQHYGSHGYPNYYQSQGEMSLERQQQNPRDGAGSQGGQPSNQTQQLWQNSY